MAKNTPKTNRVDETAADQKLIDGLTKHATTITSLVIAGATMTTKDIIGTLQTRITGSLNAQTTRASWQAAVLADHAERAKTKTFASGLRQALLVAFAGQVDVLADFGLTPRKAAVITPAQKIARAAKSKATRAARHTMGSVQKAQITGATPAPAPVVPSPIPAGPPPAPVTAPAAPVPVTAPAAPVPVTPAPAPAVAPAPAPAAAPATSAVPVTPAPVPPAPVPQPAAVPTPPKA